MSGDYSHHPGADDPGGTIRPRPKPIYTYPNIDHLISANHARKIRVHSDNIKLANLNPKTLQNSLLNHVNMPIELV